MTARTRLILTVTGSALLLVIPALYGVHQLAELRDIALELRSRHAAASVDLGLLQAELARLDRFQRSYLATPQPELLEGMQDALSSARERVEALADAGYTAEAAAVAWQLNRLATASQEIETLVESGKLDQATASFENIKPQLQELEGLFDRVAASIDRRSVETVQRAEQISSSAATTTLIGLIGALAAALGLGLWTTGAITSPLRRLRGAMAQVAGGEFEAPADLPYDNPDEIGDLSRSFRSMAQQLQELERLRAEFVSVASHELRTPINIISGYATLMEEGVLGTADEAQREAIALIIEQTRVLSRLADQLLDISRIEAGGLRIEREPVDVRDFFRRLGLDFEALAKQRGIDFAVTVEDSAPDTVFADPEALRTGALGNVISNAFKFTSDGGRIRVTVRGESGQLRIDVSDTGIGIPADQLPRIFEKYYQVGQQARSIGAGLGLAIARQIVEAHGGTISAQSEVGKGTTFTLLLPVHAADAASEPADRRRARIFAGS